MSSDTSQVRRALIALLSADAQLHALLPDGVYFGTAPLNRLRFLFLRQETHVDEPMQVQALAFETVSFLIKAVIQSSSINDVDAAAVRLMDLLNYQPLTINGYTLMVGHRTEDVSFNEVDDTNRYWQHGGGVYEFVVQPIAQAAPGASIAFSTSAFSSSAFAV